MGIGYVVRRRHAFVVRGGLVDEGEGHLHLLRVTIAPRTDLRQSGDARSDQGVRRVHEVAGVLDVAAQAEEQALAGDQLLVRQAARVVAADVRAIADVALALVPDGCVSEATVTPTADQHAVVVEADEWTHERGVTLSR